MNLPNQPVTARAYERSAPGSARRLCTTLARATYLIAKPSEPQDLCHEHCTTHPTDSASIAEGERLARIRGCMGCHGDRLEGEAHADNFMDGHTVAPNLTASAHTLSTAEFARAVRHGVRANGEGLQEMPSPMFYHLSDTDLGRIIAYVRSLPRVEGRPYRFSPGPRTRWVIAKGEWLPWPEDIRAMGPRMAPAAPGDTLRLGEYLARTVCSECHGLDLMGQDETPPLLVGAAYPNTAFVHLMRTGVPLGGRDLRLLDDVARSRFVYLTDAEIAALHAYLRTLATRGLSPTAG